MTGHFWERNKVLFGGWSIGIAFFKVAAQESSMWDCHPPRIDGDHVSQEEGLSKRRKTGSFAFVANRGQWIEDDKD
jgi:hypothetical protein